MSKMLEVESVNEAYIALTRNFQEGEAKRAMGRQQGGIYELRDVEINIRSPRKNIVSVPFRNLSRKYMAGEFALFMGQKDDEEDYVFYSKRWKDLSYNGKINSAYGKRIFEEFNPVIGKSRFEYALEQLVANPETKNAVVMMRDDRDIVPGLKDRCCTLYFQFFIREGRLDMRTQMRSTDFWYGLPYDVFWFTTVMQIMLYRYNKARPTYVPEAQLGTYTHACSSLHVYENEWEKVATAELPVFHDPQKDYQFPVWGLHEEAELSSWLLWEEAFRKEEGTLEEKANYLRDSKFHPFLETMGSFLVNKIKTRYATPDEMQFFMFCQKDAQRSKCIDRKVGALVCDKEGHFAYGHNEVLECNSLCADKFNRICSVQHAEVNTLEKAKVLGIVPHKAYVTLYPCLPCMKALEAAGVQEVVVLGFSHKGATGTATLIDPAFVGEL